MGGTNPFVSHGFLRALEESGSVDKRAGWGVQHLLARDGAGQLVGVAPLYVKAHSYGCGACDGERGAVERTPRSADV